ncbi:MAG: DUF2283 domain-containing protein [Gammaproteobacteria bacterium]|nr:DUF2283 domain-containing protein [Gammaproteobacteria bacterium]
MKITYDSKEDILLIKFNNKTIQKDVSFGWNINIGLTRHNDIGQISILDAKAGSFLPIQLPSTIVKTIAKFSPQPKSLPCKSHSTRQTRAH